MARKKSVLKKLLRRWEQFSFKHTTLAIVLTIVFVLLLDTAIVRAAIDSITSFGYLGIFVTGILLVSFFTAAPAVVLLVNFTDHYSIYTIALIAGLGSMFGDWLILRFAEDQIARGLKPVARKMKLISFINMLHKKRFRPLTATLGALIIATPFPDEVGIALLGLSHISTTKLLLITYILNTAGIVVLLFGFSAI